MSNIRNTFDYKWVIIAVSFLMVFTVLGFCSSAKSLYISAICSALDISRSAFSINDSFRYVTTSVVNIFFGALVARFGLKKLIAAGFVSLIISSVLYGLAMNVFVFYIGGIFLGIGISWTTTTMVGAIVNRWCKKKRGTVMGLILASNGIGATLAIQILSPIIYKKGAPFSYQKSYYLVAMILFVVGIIVTLLFRENPKTQDETAENKEKTSIWEGIEFSDAVKKTYFFGAAICVFLTGMVLQGITGIATPHLTDVGLSATYVAAVLSVHSICISIFKFLTGFIYDKFGLRITTSVCFTAAAVAMLLLANVVNSDAGKAISLLYAIVAAIALPLETVMLPLYSNDLFGEKSFNKILGIFASVCTAGFAVGAPITNLCYDITGSYNLAIYIACGIIVVVTILMQFIIKSAYKEKVSDIK